MESEPMEVDDLEVYKFDDLIDNRIKLNDSSDRLRNESGVFEGQENRYENKAGTFLTGIDIFSEEEKQKKEERAKRFGLTDKVNNSSSEKEDLYSSLGVDENSEAAKNLRLSVIHMRGTDDMSTKDIFKYFEFYGPSSIEWINDVSCNIVWLDPITAARALKGLSKKIIGLKAHNKTKQEENDDDASMIEIMDDDELLSDTENTIHIKDIKYPLPPGQWRKGIDCPKSQNIFLRFATYADKKPHNAEKMSEYYKKYGNPNFGGERGIISQTRKRIYKQIQNTGYSDKTTTDNGAAKVLKNPWGDLSQNWGMNDAVESNFKYVNVNSPKEQASNVKERLGIKVVKHNREPSPSASDYSEEDSQSDSDDAWCGRNKVLRMRMHADDEEAKIKKKRMKIVEEKQNHSIKSDDLRSRLQHKRENPMFKEAIQVVVMNPRAIKKDLSYDDDDSETEEGEIVENSSNSEDKDKEEDEDNDGCEVEIDEDEDEKNSNSSSSSDISEKEVQGPKGSVVKVVAKQKPKVASTVWARLNHSSNSNQKNRKIPNREYDKRDLRHSIKGDLRSRIGNSMRGRSPLRIEVKNDKYV